MHVYFDKNGIELNNFTVVKNYWAERGCKIEIFVPNVDDLKKDDTNGCQICKKERKIIIDRILESNRSKVTIMTGYTVYDILAYLNIIMLSTRLQPQNESQLKNELKRQMDN